MVRSLAIRFASAALLLTAVLVVAWLALSRPIHMDHAWSEATRAVLQRTTGLRIEVHGRVEVTVFPRPMVVAHDVGVDGEAVSLEAAMVRGVLSPTALLFGRTQLDKIEIDDASGSLDADALLRQVQRTPNTAGAATEALSDPELPPTLTLTAAMLQIRSIHPGASGFLGNLHLLVTGLRGGTASLSAGANWHGEHADVTGRLDSLAQFVEGRSTAGSVKVRSPLGSASMTGLFENGWRGVFKGSVVASSPDLSALLRIAGLPPGVLAGIGHFGFSGTSASTADGIAFEDAHVAVNDDELEGTLGLQMDEDRVMLIGTLAAEKLDVSPFLATIPSLRTHGSWNTESIPFSAVDLHDADLRISVSRLLWGDLHADDVALSVLCRKGRMELSLGEARAYGGLLKARLFTTGTVADAGVKADLSWSQIDLAALSKTWPGGLGTVSGVMSGYLSVDGSGNNAEEIMRNLGGKGQASWRQGQVQSVPIADALLQEGAGAPSSPVSFDLATMAFTVIDGLLSLDDASVSGQSLHRQLTGETYLPGGHYLFSSVPTEAVVSDGNASPLPILRRVAGVWGGAMQRLDGPSDSETGALRQSQRPDR